MKVLASNFEHISGGSSQSIAETASDLSRKVDTNDPDTLMKLGLGLILYGSVMKVVDHIFNSL